MSTYRRVYRQRDWQAWAIIGLLLALIPVVFWAGGPEDSSWPFTAGAFALALAGFAVGVHLAGPSTSVVVTPEAMVIRNIFTVQRIARSLLPGPDEIDTTFDIDAFHTTFDHSPMRAGHRWLAEALRDVGPLPDDGRRTRRPRWVNIILAVAIVGYYVGIYRAVT